jgi:hypothetical protein
MNHASGVERGNATRNPEPGGTIRTFFVSLLGAFAFVAGFFFIRHQRDGEAEVKGQVPAGERMARTTSLERLRELGL